MQKITTFLTYEDKAEEAVNFYTSIIKNSKINSIERYAPEVPGMGGKVLSASFQLAGQEFIALDGGPHFQIHRWNFTFLQLREPARSGRILGEALRGRRERTVRLA